MNLLKFENKTQRQSCWVDIFSDCFVVFEETSNKFFVVYSHLSQIFFANGNVILWGLHKHIMSVYLWNKVISPHSDCEFDPTMNAESRALRWFQNPTHVKLQAAKNARMHLWQRNVSTLEFDSARDCVFVCVCVCCLGNKKTRGCARSNWEPKRPLLPKRLKWHASEWKASLEKVRPPSLPPSLAHSKPQTLICIEKAQVAQSERRLQSSRLGVSVEV